MTEDADEPKLIIDEDYKSQVEREKQEARSKQEQSGSVSQPAEQLAGAAEDSTTAQTADSAASTQADIQDLPPPPPATIQMLVTSLATQAVAALGQLPGPEGQSLPPNPEYARHFIDLIGMLGDKTKGNLTGEEHQYLQDTLHQLRMFFVEFSKHKESSQQ